MISVHTLVKNESRFIWYSVMSVVRHVDRITIWDTGSSDETPEIIKKIENSFPGKDKVFSKNLKIKTFKEDEVRQAMLEAETGETNKGWILLLDGDEIWWEDSIRKLADFIRKEGENYESVIVPTVNVIGDIFHYQKDSAGRYKFGKLKGHYTLRAFNRGIPGLKCVGGHGQLGYQDESGKMIQDRDPKKIKFVNSPYLHCTHLPRSVDIREDRKVLKREIKRKHELGEPFPKDFYFPEVFFRPRPKDVTSPWQNMSFGFKLVSFFETPLRIIHRRYFPERVGY